jgi:hypothetical protein
MRIASPVKAGTPYPGYGSPNWQSSRYLIFALDSGADAAVKMVIASAVLKHEL